jgi:hypothetical protein
MTALVVILSFLAGIAFQAILGDACVELFKVLTAKVFRLTGFATIPKVEIGIAVPPNQASEEHAEWIHLTATNIGFKRAGHVDPAKNAKVELCVNGRLYDLMFRTQHGPELTQDLFKGHPYYIPLCARMKEQQWLLCGNLLDMDKCYITDCVFLTKRFPGAILSDGQYKIEVRLRYDGGEVPQQFELTIPRDGDIVVMPIAKLKEAE